MRAWWRWREHGWGGDTNGVCGEEARGRGIQEGGLACYGQLVTYSKQARIAYSAAASA